VDGVLQEIAVGVAVVLGAAVIVWGFTRLANVIRRSHENKAAIDALRQESRANVAEVVRALEGHGRECDLRYRQIQENYERIEKQSDERHQENSAKFSRMEGKLDTLLGRIVS